MNDCAHAPTTYALPTATAFDTTSHRSAGCTVGSA
jgi:hypothetical protein